MGNRKGCRWVSWAGSIAWNRDREKDRLPPPGGQSKQVCEGSSERGGHGKGPEGIAGVEFFTGIFSRGRELGWGAVVDIHGHLVIGDAIFTGGQKWKVRQLIVVAFR